MSNPVSGTAGSGLFTVLASIGLSIVSSVLVNYVSITQEISKNRQAEIDREVESWYQRLISNSLRLRREALRIEYGEQVRLEGRTLVSEGGEDLSQITGMVESILDLHTEAPPEIDHEILHNIQELGDWHDRADEEKEQLTTSIVKTEIQARAEELVDLAVEQSERADEPPY